MVIIYIFNFQYNIDWKATRFVFNQTKTFLMFTIYDIQPYFNVEKTSDIDVDTTSINQHCINVKWGCSTMLGAMSPS